MEKNYIGLVFKYEDIPNVMSETNCTLGEFLDDMRELTNAGFLEPCSSGWKLTIPQEVGANGLA